MATITGIVNSDEYAAAYVSEPATKLDVTLNYGKLRYISASYTFDAADELGVSGTIKLFKMPKGARVFNMYATAPAAGATGEATIGWLASVETDENGTVLEAADADGFYTADQFDPGDAALDRRVIASTRPGLLKKFAAEVDVQLVGTEITADSGGDTWLIEALVIVE